MNWTKLNECLAASRAAGDLSAVREVTIRLAALNLLDELKAEAPERLVALEEYVANYDFTSIDAHGLASCALGLEPAEQDPAPLTGDQMIAVYGVPDATTAEAALFGHDLLLFRNLKYPELRRRADVRRH